MSESEPQSPCISICYLDEHEVCQGCFRSANEIASWLMVGSQEKREILSRAQQRREQAGQSRPS